MFMNVILNILSGYHFWTFSMKKCIVFLFFCLVFSAEAQIPDTLILKADSAHVCDSGLIFEKVEQMPGYRDGNEKLITTLNKSIGLDRTVEGSIYVKMVVNCKGQICSIQVRKGINPEVNSLIGNALFSAGNWMPGKQNGHPIDCLIGFRLDVKKGKIVQ